MLYVVTEDGYRHPWGSKIYLVGVYDDKETAESVVKNIEKNLGYGRITEIALNSTHMLKYDDFGDMRNDLYLGGYAE